MDNLPSTVRVLRTPERRYVDWKMVRHFEETGASPQLIAIATQMAQRHERRQQRWLNRRLKRFTDRFRRCDSTWAGLRCEWWRGHWGEHGQGMITWRDE